MNHPRRWRQKKYTNETRKVFLLPLIEQPFFNTFSLLQALDPPPTPPPYSKHAFHVNKVITK